MAHWASVYDYNDRVLTVDQSVSQDGCTPCLLRVAAIRASSNVRATTPMPLDLGAVSSSAPGGFQIRYHVPPGINSFMVVSPAVYLTDVAPYFSKNSTGVTARAGGISAKPCLSSPAARLPA